MAPSKKHSDTGMVGSFAELRFRARWRSTPENGLDYDAGPPLAHVIADILDLEARRHPFRAVTYAALAQMSFGVRRPNHTHVAAVQGEMARVRTRLHTIYKRKLLRLGGEVRAAVDVADWRSVEGPRRKRRAELAVAQFIETAMLVDPVGLSQNARRQFFDCLRDIAEHRDILRNPEHRVWLTKTLAREWDRH